MANANPVLKGYPSPAPSCSSKRHFIAGIQTTVYGLDELARRPQSRKAACIWLLHGRLGRQENMQPMAHSVIHAWSRYLDTHDGKDVVGLIAITFDQRNHDSRTVDVSANADWKGGNPGHGVDMFSIYRTSQVSIGHAVALITRRGNSVRSIPANGLCRSFYLS